MIYYIVYKTTNTVNGKIYVGVHRTANLDDGYLGSGKIIKRAIDKYGVDSFTREILETFKTKNEACLLEADIVNEDFVKSPNTYNLKLGGEGGFDHLNTGDDNHKGRCSRAGKVCLANNGREFYQELGKKGRRAVNEKYSNKEQAEWRKNPPSFLGKNHTDVSKSKIGKANSIIQTGKGNSNYGKCWIYSLKEKRSISIPKDELQKYIDQGWNKGRKIKFN